MCAAVVNVFLLRMSMLQDIVIVSVREDTACMGMLIEQGVFTFFFCKLLKNVVLLILFLFTSSP
jgi:hypothetical protein